jgi:hypothetical protein
MKRLCSLLVSIFFLMSLLASDFSKPAIAQAPTPPTPPIYLPLVVLNSQPSPGQSIVQIIDQDIASGKLTPEQGLVDKVFATFSDPRLPAQYAGGSIGGDGDGVMMDVASQWDQLSAGAQSTLRPFLLPAYQAGSWFSVSHPGTAMHAEQVQADFWASALSKNGKVKFYWPARNAIGQALAAGLKAAMDNKIWDSLTKYMGKEPILGPDGKLSVIVFSSYYDLDGTVVPFDPGTGGITVRPGCAKAAGIIYIPINRNLGDELTPGAIQSLAHEFMHTLQYTYNVPDCDQYKWLREATAKWSEDYVYHLANSEHPRAIDYLSTPSLALNDPTFTRYYGAWVLPYYLTRKLGDTNMVRHLWEKAETTNNSFEALYDGVSDGMRDYFWGIYLPALWNLAPYDQYYKDNDKLTDTVQAESPNPIPVKLTNGYFTYALGDNLKTGAARFYHFAFTDSSVRSFTVLNGIGKDLYKESAWDSQWNLGDALQEDQVYGSDDLSDSDATGANLILMLKATGENWQPVPMSSSSYQQGAFSYCFDSQTRIDDMVVIQSNSDWMNPDHVIKHQDEPTTVVASDLPCYGLQGTGKDIDLTQGTGNHLVTLEFDSTVTFGGTNSYSDLLGTYINNPFVYPEINLPLEKLHTDWTISGSDGQCAYSGSGSFDQGPDQSAGSESATILSGILPGSPSYRGYQGLAGLEGDPPEITYNVTGHDCPGQETAEIGWQIEIPIVDCRADIKIPTGGGTLTGSCKRDSLADVGHEEHFSWNLKPVTK